MREVVPDIYMVEGLRQSHVYVLDTGEGLAMVDTGVGGDATKIVADLEAAGYSLSDLRAIVVTHAHGDHIGGLAELVHRSGAQVLAHEDEVPYLEQTASLSYGSLLRRFLGWVMARMDRSPPCPVDRALHDGEEVDVLGGFQVVHAPGHTPGCIVLYHPERRVLFSGDVLFHGNPLSGKGPVQSPPSFFSVDPGGAEASARQVAALPVEVVCFGHGEPLTEGAAEVLAPLRAS